MIQAHIGIIHADNCMHKLFLHVKVEAYLGRHALAYIYMEQHVKTLLNSGALKCLIVYRPRVRRYSVSYVNTLHSPLLYRLK